MFQFFGFMLSADVVNKECIKFRPPVNMTQVVRTQSAAINNRRIHVADFQAAWHLFLIPI